MDHADDDFYKDLIFRSLYGTLSQDEQQQLDAWLSNSEYNERMYDQLGQMWRTRYEDPVYINRMAMRERIIREGFRSGQTSRPDYGKRLMGMAAMISLVLLFAYLVNSIGESEVVDDLVVEKIVKQNPAGMKSRIILPDSSVVWLNSESRLSYLKGFTDSSRLVELEGEAFFEIRKDPSRPFIVKSGTVFTQALGTSFDVRNYPEEPNTNVGLLTGKVKITSSRSDSPYYLEPREQIVISKDSKEVKKGFLDEQLVAWTKNILIFESDDFETVIHRLERWYGVSIDHTQYSQINTWNYHAEFKNQSLERVLSRIGYTHDFDFTIEGREITLYNKNETTP